MRAFTLVDLIGVLVVIMLVTGLVFPSIQASREAARRTACMDKLRQIGVAMHQYHEVHSTLPGHKVGPGSQKRISAFTLLLPHIGYQSLYDDIAEQRWQVGWNRAKHDADGKPMKDADDKDIPGPYCTPIPLFLCPEDSAGLTKRDDEIGFNNYVFSHGDWMTDQNETFSRGPFVPENFLTFDDIVDGLSNTLAMSERSIASNRRKLPDAQTVREYDGTEKTQGKIVIAKDDIDTEEPEKPSILLCFQKSIGDLLNDPEKLQIDRGRSGTRWSDGQHFFTVTNTILPPNWASCMLTTDDRKPILAPPTSYHLTGVNGLMLDGAVRFILNTIDCGGDYADKKCVKEGQSPFGVWGAMGSIADTKPIEVK
jgi:type II secretory pathway pseudopilin PulG